MSDIILDKREIEKKFGEYLMMETKDRFFLRKKADSTRLAENYLKNARQNLLVAKALLDLSIHGDVKKLLSLPDSFQCYSWSVAIHYYAMYHAALSALAKEGYESDDHKATRYALAKLYVIKDELEKEFLEIFDQGKKILEEEYIVTLDDARKKDQTARYSSSQEYEKSQADAIQLDATSFVHRLAEIIEFEEKEN
jgi:uncharacterized protein (UPF0332 family)